MAMSFGTNQFAKLVARDAQAPIHGDVLFFRVKYHRVFCKTGTALQTRGLLYWMLKLSCKKYIYKVCFKIGIVVDITWIGCAGTRA
jgi:hypothetical protein